MKMKTIISILAALTPPLQAETITIGKGSGLVWEGLPFNQTLTGKMVGARSYPDYGLLSVSHVQSSCMSASSLKEMAGYKVYPLPGAKGVGIVPRASGNVTFGLYNGGAGTLTGTIGLPETKGVSSTEGNVTNNEKAWCIPATNTDIASYYDESADRTATLSGTWSIVADGNQENTEINLPPLYFASFAFYGGGDRKIQIFPSDVTLRISTLECMVDTPTTIDFGTVIRDIREGAMLAKKTVQLNTSCGQTSNFINTNINVQFRALTGLYQGAPSRLSLGQGGGYITGEIDNGVTGSGACESAAGVSFDNKQIKIGKISSAQQSLVLDNKLTWRLCSGGRNLPSGAVDAAAELLVTFN